MDFKKKHAKVAAPVLLAVLVIVLQAACGGAGGRQVEVEREGAPVVADTPTAPAARETIITSQACPAEVTGQAIATGQAESEIATGTAVVASMATQQAEAAAATLTAQAESEIATGTAVVASMATQQAESAEAAEQPTPPGVVGTAIADGIAGGPGEHQVQAGDGSVTVTITQEQANEMLRAAMAESGGNHSLQNPTIAFTGGNIVLQGDVTEPVPAHATLVVRPYVQNGALQFDVVEAKLDNGFKVPPAMLETIEASLNEQFASQMNTMPQNAELKEIVVGEGTLTLVGALK